MSDRLKKPWGAEWNYGSVRPGILGEDRDLVVVSLELEGREPGREVKLRLTPDEAVRLAARVRHVADHLDGGSS